MAACGLEFSLELIVLSLGAWLYARRTTFVSANGRYLFWGFVILLATLQIYANFGPPPSSSKAMAVTALAFYAVLALLAAWVERIATISTEATSGRMTGGGPGLTATGQ